MPIVMCGCGQFMEVAASPAAQLVRCPRCERTLSVAGTGYAPAYAAAPSQRALTRKSVGIVWGILILLTIGIPWGLYIPTSTRDIDVGDIRSREDVGRAIRDSIRVQWSWDILKEKQTPGKFKAFLIGFWVIGLLAIVLGAALPRIPLAVTYLVLATAALILSLVVFVDARGMRASFALEEGGSNALPILGSIFVALLLVLAHARTRLGASIPIGIVEALVAVGVVIVVAIALVKGIDGYRQLADRLEMSPASTQKTLAHVVTITFLVLRGMLGLAAVLALAHGAAVTMRSPGLSSAAIVLINLVILFMALVALIVPSVAEERFAPETPAILNMFLLFCATLFLFVEGLAGLISELFAGFRRHAAQPRYAPAPVFSAPAASPAPIRAVTLAPAPQPIQLAPASPPVPPEGPAAPPPPPSAQ